MRIPMGYGCPKYLYTANVLDWTSPAQKMLILRQSLLVPGYPVPLVQKARNSWCKRTPDDIAHGMATSTTNEEFLWEVCTVL
eukprot:744895-Rhodomonas_salina.2